MFGGPKQDKETDKPKTSYYPVWNIRDKDKPREQEQFEKKDKRQDAEEEKPKKNEKAALKALASLSGVALCACIAVAPAPVDDCQRGIHKKRRQTERKTRQAKAGKARALQRQDPADAPA